MSTTNSDRASLNGDTTTMITVTKSILGSLSIITASLENANLENNIREIGSYFYRVSLALKELADNNADSVIEILQSLSQCEDLAKRTLGRLQQSEENISDYDLKTLIKQLEGIINHIGEHLSLIPISAFNEEKYAENTIQSLAEEMRRCNSDTIKVTDQSEADSISIESDLLTVSTVACTDNSHLSDTPRRRSHKQNTKLVSRSKGNTTVAAQFLEPVYKSFCCPLTSEIMDDPVTVQSGVTYERKAIIEYFAEFGDSDKVVCPVTREELRSRVMTPNINLKNIIQEWKDRNDIAQLKVIRAAFSIGSTDDMVLEALMDLRSICERSPKVINEVCISGIIPLIVKLLELSNRNVRCDAIEMIRLLAMENDGKEMIGRTPAVAATIRQLSSSYRPIRHAALLLLIELSKSNSLSEKIGYVRGGILILIQTKYNRSVDTFASEAADHILRNLEQCPYNIKLMAENGLLEPLLNHLNEGNRSSKLQMVTYLGEVTLEESSKIYVIERVSPILIQMLQNEDSLTRLSVFKAFAQTSSNPGCGKALVETGIVTIIIDELFTKKSVREPTKSLKEASAVLANILESGVKLENLTVNSKGHTMDSGYVAFNIMNMIKYTKADNVKLNLIRILYQIAKSTKSAAPVVSSVEESEASYTLVELLNNPNDEMAVAAIKLLNFLSSHIGHFLIERLCKTNGQPGGLIQSNVDPGKITERQALSVCLLGRLPHDNITLNTALVTQNTVPRVLQAIYEIRRDTRQNRYSLMLLEGLVGVLVRFTATLYDPQMLFLAVKYNFTMEFTDLLTETSVEEIKILAATGLEKLSAESINLSKQPKLKRNKSVQQYLPDIFSRSSRKSQTRLCIVHRGVCSAQNTFCLIEANSVERLLLCLENRNVKVAEAALSALSTLVDDKVEIGQGVNMLIEMNALQQILKVLKYQKSETLWHKALWVLERFLMEGSQKHLSLLSQDRSFYASVVKLFHHGDTYTRQVAENLLRRLDKMPSFTSSFAQ